MHRRPLIDMLARYEREHPGEWACAGRIRALVEAHPDCFERSCAPGHITASAWILSPDRSHCLLTHHKKLGRWLQLGGHADGDTDLQDVALREAREESGMQDFAFLGEDPLDLDVHLIPARADEPAHEHHDIRFLLVAGPDQTLKISQESNDLRWFPRDALHHVALDESSLRMAHKSSVLLRGR